MLTLTSAESIIPAMPFISFKGITLLTLKWQN